MIYKITFELASPISFLEKPVFDSLLAYCYMREKLGGFEQKLDLLHEECIDFPSLLPLKSKESAGAKYSIASWMFWEESQCKEFQESYKKRFDFYNDSVLHFNGKTEKIAIDKGEFKSYDIPFTVYSIPRVWFFFESEEVSDVIFLLKKHLMGIGKKTAYGFGRIKSFLLQECEEDPFVRIIRPIPAEQPTPDTRFCGFRPPYWARINQRHCYVK